MKHQTGSGMPFMNRVGYSFLILSTILIVYSLLEANFLYDASGIYGTGFATIN